MNSLVLLKQAIDLDPKMSKAFGHLDLNKMSESELQDFLGTIQESLVQEEDDFKKDLGHAATCQKCVKSFPRKTAVCGKCKSVRYCGAKCDILPNDAISELMEQPFETRQSLCEVLLRSNQAIKNARVVHTFFVWGEGSMCVLPFSIRADRSFERNLGTLTNAPDWWKDPDWNKNVVRRLIRSAYAEEGSGGMAGRSINYYSSKW